LSKCSFLVLTTKKNNPEAIRKSVKNTQNPRQRNIDPVSHSGNEIEVVILLVCRDWRSQTRLAVGAVCITA